MQTFLNITFAYVHISAFNDIALGIKYWNAWDSIVVSYTASAWDTEGLDKTSLSNALAMRIYVCARSNFSTH